MRRGPSARPAGGLIQVAEGLTGFVALLGLVLVLYSVTAYGPRLMLLLTGAILPLTAAAALTWLASAWPARQALRRTPIRAYLDAS